MYKVHANSSHAGYICYDDGCHLRKYSTNPCRCDLTPTTQLISNMIIVIDKMHMAGHVGKWCQENCDLHKFPYLTDVSTPTLNCYNIFNVIMYICICLYMYACRLTLKSVNRHSLGYLATVR